MSTDAEHAEPRIWWLNLDAERELAVPSARATPRRVAEQVAASARSFAPLLCGKDPYLVPGQTPRPQRAGERVLVWCPTPGALEAITAHGLLRPRAPALSVLRAVNDRRFALSLSGSDELEQLKARLLALYPAGSDFQRARFFQASPPWLAPSWPPLLAARTAPVGPVRLKRLFGFAGKGQRTLPLWPDPEPTAETDRWLRGAVAKGGFVLEPEVRLLTEMSMHGLVTESTLLLGEPCRMHCDPFGAPLNIERAEESSLPPLLADSLRETGGVVALALRRAGYFGPFGIDARLFEWQERPGVQLLGDLNARFTVGWSTGMGPAREAALGALLERTYD